MKKDDDVQLIQKTLSGDEAAFGILVQKHQKSVHALVWRKIGDFHYAEEITQDTFLQVYRKLRTLKDPHKFDGWLYVIANRLCIDWMRKKNLTTQSLEHTPVEEIENASYTRHVTEQQQTVLYQQRHAIVKKLLTKLPESERTIMTLFYLGEMTAKEISKFLGVSVSTIHTRLHRARKRLQAKEETLVREVLGNVQIPTGIYQNIMREIPHIKPLSPTGGKQPIVPWAIATSTIVLVVMMLGASNQFLAHFQRPYSFDATSEMTVELIEAPIVINLPLKPDIRNQIGRSGKGIGAGPQDSETFAVTQPSNENRVLTQEEKKNVEICTQNLLVIGGAIQAYEKEHSDLPEWLSDLHPKYLPDPNILICPADTSGGKAGYPLNVDPKMSVSYGYEFHPEYRTYKSRQRLIYGDDMPLVRCRHHTNDDFQSLNLSFSSKIYESTNVWESTPQDMYGSPEAAITILEETLEKHHDDVDFYELYPLLVSLYIEVENEPAADTLIERFKSVMKPDIAGYITLCNMLNAIGRHEDVLAVVKAAERQNPDNIFIPRLLAYTYGKLGDTELAESYERNTDLLDELIGKPAPDFSAIDLNGDSIALQDYRGKVVLLNFWAMWYGPSLLEIPNLKKVYDTYKDEGFDIIGISLDYDGPKLRDYSKENNIPWRQILDNVAGKNLIAQQYAIRGIPAIHLIDREGRLITHEARGMDFAEFVAEAVKNKSKD